MGLGHVPQEPIRAASARAQFQRPQRRRVAPHRPVATSRATSRSTAAARTARGKWAEDLVARWYERNGYRIIARNWRCSRGELDVVALLGDTLIICEVKARASNAFGTPADAVTLTKQLRLRRATAAMLAEIRAEQKLKVRSLRFDVACVLGTQLEMLIDAF